MSKSEIIEAEPRTKVGTRHARRLRAQGRIPIAISTDADQVHLDLHIDEHEFLGTRRRHTHLYDIEVGGARHTAVVRHLDWDVLGERIVHIEFKRVRRDIATEADVALEFTGHPKSGVLNHLIAHVTVRCLPEHIPDSIEVKVDGLLEGASIFARDLLAPTGVEILLDPAARVAIVVGAQRIEAPAPAEGEAVEGVAAAAPEGETEEESEKD